MPVASTLPSGRHWELRRTLQLVSQPSGQLWAQDFLPTGRKEQPQFLVVAGLGLPVNAMLVVNEEHVAHIATLPAGPVHDPIEARAAIDAEHVTEVIRDRQQPSLGEGGVHSQ